MDWAIAILNVLGGFFILTACIGLVRLPDLYTRMQATTKASSLGFSLMLIAGMLYFQTNEVIIKSLCTIVFIFLTACVGAHAIAKAAYLMKVQMWEGTKFDDLKETLSPPKSKPKAAPKKTTDPREKISDIFRKLRDKNI